jgi:hypothetical protein
MPVASAPSGGSPSAANGDWAVVTSGVDVGKWYQMQSGSWAYMFDATGPTGATGATGAAGADGDDVGWAGQWSNGVNYVPGDIVEHNGYSYICHTASLGNDPATDWAGPSSYWGLIAERGGQGYGGIAMAWSTDTSVSDPGSGYCKVNHASLSSATTLSIDQTNLDGTTISGFIDTWDDSTSTVNGILYLQSPDDGRSVFYSVGAVNNPAGYREVGLTYLGGDTSTFTNGATVYVLFVRTGDKGDTGSTGSTGATGQGVPTGGATGYALTKVSATNYDTTWTDVASQAELDAHTSDTSAAHAASAISVSSTTLVGVGTDVQAVFEEIDNAIADHLADTSDAHDASAISVLDTNARFAAADVEAALVELEKNTSYCAALYLDSTGSPTHTSSGGWQRVSETGGGGGSPAITTDFDVVPSGVTAQVTESTGRITIRKTGLYLVSAAVRFGAIADAKQVGASAYINGAQGPHDVRMVGVAGTPSARACDVVSLASGDYVELYAYQNDSASEAYQVTNKWMNRLAVKYLGPSS